MIKIGQYYKTGSGAIYILAQVDYCTVALIGLRDGSNRWSDPVKVISPQNISPVEWEKISGIELKEDCEYHPYELDLVEVEIKEKATT